MHARGARFALRRRADGHLPLPHRQPHLRRRRPGAHRARRSELREAADAGGISWDEYERRARRGVGVTSRRRVRHRRASSRSRASRCTTSSTASALRDLGVDVFYLEDNRGVAVPPVATTSPTSDAEYTVPVAARAVRGASSCAWAYRDPRGRYHGAGEAEAHARCARRRPAAQRQRRPRARSTHHRAARVLAYVDTDPGFVQVARGDGDARHARVAGGARRAASPSPSGSARPGCRVPDGGLRLAADAPARAPAVLGRGRRRARRRLHDGHELAGVPLDRVGGRGVGPEGRRVPARRAACPRRHRRSTLELAPRRRRRPARRRSPPRAGGSSTRASRRATSGRSATTSPRSRGEVTVAKQAYVRSRGGWFSERSANYLAAGRPVVAQDTGWREVLGTQRHAGLLAVLDAPRRREAAVRAVEADPAAPRARAARRVAARALRRAARARAPAVRRGSRRSEDRRRGLGRRLPDRRLLLARACPTRSASATSGHEVWFLDDSGDDAVGLGPERGRDGPGVPGRRAVPRPRADGASASATGGSCRHVPTRPLRRHGPRGRRSTCSPRPTCSSTSR